MQPILAKQKVVDDTHREIDDFYPDDDGKPMSENTLQFEWITLIKQGLELAFEDRPDVFVAGDLLWYPVEGDNKIRQAPDVMVAIGRPKGYRGSYKQFLEEGIAPQVVFEILSPGNRVGEMIKKYDFYEEYGVLEYYVYDPHKHTLEAYSRPSVDDYWIDSIVQGFTEWNSGVLGLKMSWIDQEFKIYQTGGTPFLSYQELNDQRRLAESILKNAKEAEKEAKLKAQKLAEKLRSLGIDPDSI